MKTTRNEAYDRIRAALEEAGYHIIALHSLRDSDNVACGDVRFFSNGREVLILQAHYEGKEVSGFDVFAPITDSNKVDDTIAAIKARA